MQTFDLHEVKIEAILEDELYTNPPLMPVVVAELTGTKQDIARVFRLTKDVASRADLKHLRRVRDTEGGTIECIVSVADETCLQDLEARFASENILKDFRIALVPSEAPRTEQQLAACHKLWPCKYAKSNYLIACIDGTVFESAERLVIRIIASKLIKHINSRRCSKTSCAVIFRYNRVYGLGLSSPMTAKANPIKHSAMLAIDSVAQNAGSSFWSCHGGEEETLQKSIQQELDTRPELEDHKMDANFLPYLCTNYDVLLTEEPCMMCAMGLVQSRIRRLFYLNLDSGQFAATNKCRPVCHPDGAIEKFLVHRDKSLNHRFEAWRIKLVESTKMS